MKYWIVILLLIFEFGNCILEKVNNDNKDKKEMNSLMMKYLKDFTEVKKKHKDGQTASDLDIIQQLMVQSWIKLLEPSKEQINKFLLPRNLKKESNVKNVENKIILDLKNKGQSRVAEAVLRYHHNDYKIMFIELTKIAKKELEALKIKGKDLEKKLISDPILGIHYMADKLYLQSYLFDFVDNRDGSQFTVEPIVKASEWSLDSLVLDTADYTETDWKKFFEVKEITPEELGKVLDAILKSSVNDWINDYLTKFANIKKSQDKETAADMDIMQQMVVQSWITLLQPKMEQISEFLPEDLETENNLDSVKTKITQALEDKGQTSVSEAVLRYMYNIRENVEKELAESVRNQLKKGHRGSPRDLEKKVQSSEIVLFHEVAIKMLLQSYLFDFVDQPYGEEFIVKPKENSSNEELKELVLETKIFNESEWHKFFFGDS